MAHLASCLTLTGRPGPNSQQHTWAFNGRVKMAVETLHKYQRIVDIRMRRVIICSIKWRNVAMLRPNNYVKCRGVEICQKTWFVRHCHILHFHKLQFSLSAIGFSCTSVAAVVQYTFCTLVSPYIRATDAITITRRWVVVNRSCWCWLDYCNSSPALLQSCTILHIALFSSSGVGRM